MVSFVFSGVSISIIIFIQVNAVLTVDDSQLDRSNFLADSLGDLSRTQLFFYLYTKKNKTHFENVTELKNLKNSSLDSELKTIFLIHGWQNDISSPMIQLVKDAYLNLGDYNIIGVDWGFGASSVIYHKSAACVQLVANYVGTFIKNLIDPMNGLNVSIDNINLVGHSLGAHVAGLVGDYFRIVEDCKTIPVIVGLDPAGPLFREQNMYSRLDIHDASYVEVIHTSNEYSALYSILGWFGVRTLGMPEAIGDVDIYPNYGGYQPNCTGFEVQGNCPHGIAYVYFAKSLNATKNSSNIAIECEGGFNDILNENCTNTNSKFYYMGDPANRANLSKSNVTESLGVYYFELDRGLSVFQARFYQKYVYPILIILLVLICFVFGFIPLIKWVFSGLKYMYAYIKRKLTAQNHEQAIALVNQNEQSFLLLAIRVVSALTSRSSGTTNP